MNARQRMLLLVTLLFVMVLASALLLIYSQHQTRKLFVGLQRSLHEIDRLDAEWSQLQLEQSAWAEHGRVERIAAQSLGMKRPAASEVVFVSVSR